MVKGTLNMKMSWNFCVDISKFNTRHLCYVRTFLTCGTCFRVPASNKRHVC
jgi:hypothetical protein